MPTEGTKAIAEAVETALDFAFAELSIAVLRQHQKRLEELDAELNRIKQATVKIAELS